MGFGTLATSPDEVHTQMFSPRSMPQKRLAELDTSHNPPALEGVSASPLKVAKKQLTRGDSSSTESTCVGSPFRSSVGSPSTSSMASLSDHEDESSAKPAEAPDLEAAAEKAMHLFREAWYAFVLERDVGYADIEDREDRAAKVGEAWVVDRYEELQEAMLDLLPFVGPLKPAAQGRDYQVVEMEARAPARRLKKSAEDLDEWDVVRGDLACFRAEPTGRAWEALAAVMAAVSIRKEKCWLEAHECCRDLETHLASVHGLKGKVKNEKRKKEIRRILEEKWCSTGCGFFSSYIIHADTKLRVAFAPGLLRPIPASLVVTTRLPLWDALQSLDDNGPLRGAAKSRAWCMAAGRQFAFQTANLDVDVDEEMVKCRADAEILQPDPKLRALLRSKKPVVVLEVVAALAPREIMKSQGLSEIVKAELANVMREAKSRGEAVLFCLGSDSPHKLAAKVYLREPIGDYGLQCGYMRCRASSDVPWARERAWADRICMCLQMP